MADPALERRFNRKQQWCMFMSALSLTILMRISPPAAMEPSARTKQPSVSAASEPSDMEEKSSKNHSFFFDAREPSALSSATGVLFSGNTFRFFEGERRFMPGWEQKWKASQRSERATFGMMEQCEQWAVVTTIFGPTEAVKVVGELPDWCTVVVADTKTPNNYVEQANLTIGSKMHFLSVNDQKKWAAQSGAAAAFVRSIPYQHFARKNIGYLYAIQHGAKFIFDLDDDNILHKNPTTGSTSDPLPNKTHLENVQVPLLGRNAFNHHHLMKASIPGSWARGFPLEQLQDEATRGKPGYIQDAIPMEKIAVMQYCAQSDPDVDAVHRLVKPLPMNFAEDTPPLQVPTHAFAPYNAQASIHISSAHWATFLPYSVPGRVSDIWRGYFAEAIFRDLGISVAFLPPKVRQDRNAHHYLADMQAEMDLYFKAGKLIEFLSQDWFSMANTVPEHMEQLWINLFERGYIEIEDVRAVQLWLEALVESSYEFPKLTRKRYDNVVLMGQFNYANGADSVIFWVQKWREVFGNVVVCGPFNETELGVLHSHGINAFWGRGDKGIVSPMENLMLTLSKYKNTAIDGVLYIHDDAFLKIKQVSRGQYPFPAQSVIGSSHTAYFPLSYQDHRTINSTKKLARFSYNIHSDGTYTKADATNYTVAGNLQKSLFKWWGFKTCVKSLTNVSKDTRSMSYKLPDGSFLAPSPTQADMLFVPMSLSDEFIKAAHIMLDSNVFLECGFPTIVHMLQIACNATVDTIELCTGWGRSRGKEGMINNCLNDKQIQQTDRYYSMFHPYKLSRGLASWGHQFDVITWAE